MYTTGLILSTKRVSLDFPPNSSSHNNNSLSASLILIYIPILLFSYYTYQMVQGNVSFSNHMSLCVVLSVLHSVIWTLWAVFLPRNEHNNKAKYICLICQVIIFLLLIYFFFFFFI